MNAAGATDPPPRDRVLAGIVLRLVAVAALALMFALVKLAGQRGVHLAETLFYRQAFALPLVTLWLARQGSLRTLATARFPAHALRMVVGLGAMALNFAALMLLPLAEATTISLSIPIFATVLAALLLGEATGLRRWLAVLTGFIGVGIVLAPTGEDINPLGAGVAVLGALATACVTILIKDLGRTEATTRIVFWFTALSMVPLGLLMLFYAQPHSGTTWAILAVMGAAGALGQLTLTGALRLAPVSIVLPMDYTSVLWAALLGWLIFQTVPGPSVWIGAPVIIASGLYIVWREHVRGRAEALTRKAVSQNG